MISVIGAGPAGCFAAISAIKNTKEKVEIFEYQNLKKKKVKCAGLVSISGIKKLGISLPDGCILNKVRGAKFYSPSGKEVIIDGKEKKAYVLDRREFDNFLLNEAIASGVKFKNEMVKNLRKIKSERIILATGTNYNLQRKFNLPYPKKFLYGAQYEMKNLECDDEFVELHFNVPGFFSWIIPLGDGCGRVGLCTVEYKPLMYLKNFIKKLEKEGRLKSRNIKEKNFGIIPIYNPKMRTEHKKIMLVGDAAAHVKATTGGGIVLGCLAAKFSYHDEYEKKWRKKIGRELYIHLMIKKFLDKLSDRNMERLFHLIEESKSVIEKEGDMDIASKLILSYAKKPKIMLKFLYKLPYFLRDLL